MFDRVDIFNPYAPGIELNGISNIIGKTQTFPNPFLQILGARWLDAQINDESGLTSTFWQKDQNVSRVILTSDFFLDDLVTVFGGIEVLNELKRIVVVFSDLPTNRKQWFKPAAMNPFLSARSGPYIKLPGFHYDSFWTEAPNPIPIVPMGCAQSWLPLPDHHNKTIFLDEPHRTLLDLLPSEDDIRSALFIHALETCKILADRGYVIYSFCREKHPKVEAIYNRFSFLNIISISEWIPFSELTLSYGRASLFFSFFAETFGYSIYENMQMGNGIITYAETFDAYRLAPMQRGVLLSVYNSPRLCADLVDEYFARYSSNEMRNCLRDEARKLFSTETFFLRLRNSTSFDAICST